MFMQVKHYQNTQAKFFLQNLLSCAMWQTTIVGYKVNVPPIFQSRVFGMQALAAM